MHFQSCLIRAHLSTLIMQNVAQTKVLPRATISYGRCGISINRYDVTFQSPLPGNHCGRIWQNGNGLAGETLEFISSSMKAMNEKYCCHGKMVLFYMSTEAMKHPLLFESFLNVDLQYAASFFIIYALLFRTPVYLGRAYFGFKWWIYFEKKHRCWIFAVLHLRHKIAFNQIKEKALRR